MKSLSPLHRMECTTENHPFRGLARLVAFRLENPTPRGCRRKPGIKADSLPLLRTTFHDEQEILGVLSLVLVETGEAGKMSLATWKRIFSESRAVLRMKRKAVREGLEDEIGALLETDFHSELTLDPALVRELAAERELIERQERARRWKLARRARFWMQCIRAAYRADVSRKRHSAKRAAIRFLRRATRAAVGDGHQAEHSRTAVYNERSRFDTYIAEGRARLAAEKAETDARVSERDTARLMLAVGA